MQHKETRPSPSSNVGKRLGPILSATDQHRRLEDVGQLVVKGRW